MTVDELESTLIQLEREATQALAEAENEAQLEELRLKYLGKNGALNAIWKNASQLGKDDKPRIGQQTNTVKSKIEETHTRRKQELYSAGLDLRLEEERIDVTQPGTGVSIGHIHPLTQITEEIIEIFYGMGFSVAE